MTTARHLCSPAGSLFARWRWYESRIAKERDAYFIDCSNWLFVGAIPRWPMEPTEIYDRVCCRYEERVRLFMNRYGWTDEIGYPQYGRLSAISCTWRHWSGLEMTASSQISWSYCMVKAAVLTKRKARHYGIWKLKENL